MFLKRPKLRDYIVFILRQDNDYDKIEISAKKHRLKHIKNIKSRGKLYHFDTEYSFKIHPVNTLGYWLIPDVFQKYDRMLIYREPSDSSGIGTEPLKVPVSVNRIEESPLILRGVTKSDILRRYRSKQKFGRWAIPPWQFFLIIGIVIVIVLLIITGTIQIEGLNR